MKNILLVLTFFLPFYLSGQWQTNGSNIYYNGGKVGIGTSNPYRGLHVKSDELYIGLFEQSQIAGADAGLKIRGSRNGCTSCDISYIDLFDYDSNELGGTEFNMARISAGMARTYGQTGYLRFYTNNGSGIVERLRITDSGKIGIGTEEPYGKVDVNVDYGTGYTGVFSGSKSYRPDGTEFHIRSEKGSAASSGDFSGIRFTVNGSDSGIASAGIYAVREESEGNGSTSLSFTTREGTSAMREHFRITSNGFVGIGTVNPLAKLSVDGTVRATEVKVLADISIPDYVFEPEYDLMSLEEVELYIKEHKHLPNIPSAKEIEKNGLDLGMMNAKLLEKVEELVLYTIDQQELINQQQETLDRQATIVEQLNNRLSELETKLENSKN